MSDIFGKMLGIFLAFTLVFLGPFIHVVASKDEAARRTIMNEMQAFLDETADSRQVTDEQLEDFYLGISGMGQICDVTVERYVRTVDPDPKNPGQVYVTYVYSDNIKEFNQGDKVKVRVHAIGYTGAELLLRSTIGVWLPKLDYTFAMRVR